MASAGRPLRGDRRAGIRSVAATVVAAIALAACSASEAEVGGRARIRVSFRPYITYAPLYIADRRGYFAEEGLEVEFVQVPSVARAVPLLVRGDLDVIPAPIAPALLTAMAAGERLRYVADKGWVDPEGCDFTVLAGYPERFARREGSGAGGALRVSRSNEPQLNFFLERLLSRKFGLSLDSDSIEEFNLPSSAELVALEQGTLDAAFMLSPQLETAIREFGVQVIGGITEVLPGYQFSMLAYGPRLLDEEPDLGRRFMVAYLRGLRDYAEGKTPENLSALAAATGVDEESLMEACWMPVHPDGVANVESLRDYVAWYVEKGLLQSAPDLAVLWDGSFVEYAGRVLAETDTKEDD